MVKAPLGPPPVALCLLPEVWFPIFLPITHSLEEWRDYSCFSWTSITTREIDLVWCWRGEETSAGMCWTNLAECTEAERGVHLTTWIEMYLLLLKRNVGPAEILWGTHERVLSPLARPVSERPTAQWWLYYLLGFPYSRAWTLQRGSGEGEGRIGLPTCLLHRRASSSKNISVAEVPTWSPNCET